MPVATSSSDAAYHAFERCNQLFTCWKAINDLMIVDRDAIQLDERDHIATLMDFLNEKFEDPEHCDRALVCWKGVTDLMIPDGSAIGSTERENIASLMQFLNEEYAIASKLLREAIWGTAVRRA